MSDTNTFIRNNFANSFLLILSLLLLGADAQWRRLEPGMELGIFNSPLYGDSVKAEVRVLRIDPGTHELLLFNASNPSQDKALTPREWAGKEKLTAVINAAMYQTDYRSSVSLMKTRGHVNNPRLSKDKSVLVFDPLKRNTKPVRIVDLQCDNFQAIKPAYGSFVQSIRMLSCEGKNVWQPSERRWSIAAVGLDNKGKLLFMHTSTPHSVSEFIDIIKKLPIGIERAMYMEGGSPAQLFIQSRSDTLEYTGNYAASAQPLPNVLGIRKRQLQNRKGAIK